MSFEHLPENWASLPLDTPGLAADVADLVVGHADRMGGCVGLVLTGPGRTMGQPCVVNDVTDDCDPAEFAPFLGQLADMVADGGGGVLFVRGRPGSVLLTDVDRRWHQVALDACREGGVPLLGAFLATPATVRAFPAPVEPADLAS
ncbi:hypothetical protein ACK8HX_15220 [Oryzobacter sp. R7]|uniref:hypothetical protein n=1 Tax=Oryzobacter faecalis TaxID=3388656 RepID=UPI00398C92BF